MKGQYKITTTKNGKVLRETDWIPNLIMKSDNYGLNLLIKGLIGNTTYGTAITKAKIGNNDTPPANNDTDLKNTIVDNIVVASQIDANNIATFEFFISDAELPNGTYKEFGIFIKNQIFARSIIFPNYTKAVGEDSTISYQLILDNI